MFRKIDHLTIYSLGLTLVSILFIVFFQVRKGSLLDEERKIMAYKTEAKELGLTLGVASDYLSSEVRKFTVTLNPAYMRNYWREVKVVNRRDQVIKRLKQLRGPKEEFDMLNEAKNLSDDLVKLETQAQRLILEVYDVPEDQMEPEIADYQLTENDRDLSLNEKVNKARELVHSAQYDAEKEKIRVPIRKFQQTIDARLDKEIEEAQIQTDRYQLLSGIWMIVLSLLIFVFAYNVIQRMATPLKDLEAQLKAGNKKVEVSTSAVAAIQHIADMMNRLPGQTPVPDKDAARPS